MCLGRNLVHCCFPRCFRHRRTFNITSLAHIVSHCLRCYFKNVLYTVYGSHAYTHTLSEDVWWHLCVLPGCEGESNLSMWIYVLLGNVLRGIGETPVQPLGISYIDDFATEENAALYVGKNSTAQGERYTSIQGHDICSSQLISTMYIGFLMTDLTCGSHFRFFTVPHDS